MILLSSKHYRKTDLYTIQHSLHNNNNNYCCYYCSCYYINIHELSNILQDYLKFEGACFSH